MRTSAPPLIRLVLGTIPTTPVTSKPKPKPLRSLSEYCWSNASGLSLLIGARFVEGSVAPCVPRFQ